MSLSFPLETMKRGGKKGLMWMDGWMELNTVHHQQCRSHRLPLLPLLLINSASDAVMQITCVCVRLMWRQRRQRRAKPI